MGVAYSKSFHSGKLLSDKKKQEKFRRTQKFLAPALTCNTVVSVCGQQVLSDTIGTIKTFHLQVSTHINRQKEENITHIQTNSPRHKGILTPPTFVWRGGTVTLSQET